MEKQLEVCDTRGYRLKYVGVCESSWKLPWNMFVDLQLMEAREASS